MRTMDNDVVVVVAVVNSNNNNNDSMNIKVYKTNWLTFVFKGRDRKKKKCTFAGVWLLIWVDVIKTITFYWLQNIRQLEMYSWCFCMYFFLFLWNFLSFCGNVMCLNVLFLLLLLLVFVKYIQSLVEQPCHVCMSSTHSAFILIKHI